MFLVIGPWLIASNSVYLTMLACKVREEFSGAAMTNIKGEREIKEANKDTQTGSNTSKLHY